MVRNFIKYFIRTVGIIFFLIVGNSGMLFLWLVNAPREVPFLKNKIEQVASGFSEDYRIKIDKSVLQWDGTEKGIGIHLNNVNVHNKQDEEVASFPDIRVNLDLLELVLGNIQFKDVLISTPRFTINAPPAPPSPPEMIGPPLPVSRQPLGPVQASAYRKTIIDILSAIERNNRQIPIRNVRMEKMELVVGKGAQEIVWDIPVLNLRFVATGTAVTFQSDMLIGHSGKDMSLELEGFLEEGQMLHINAKTRQVTPAFITDMLPEIAWFSALDVLLDTDAELRLNPDGLIESVQFKAETSAVDVPELPGFSLKASGKITIHAKVGDRERVPEIHMDAAIANLPAPLLQKFWPPEYGKNARDWLMPHILNGKYDKAEVKINLSPEEMISGNIKEESIRGSLHFSDMEVSYYEKFPSLLEGKGTVVMDTDSAEINVEYGRFQDSFIPEGKITIIDLDKDDVRMEVNGKLSGSMADLLSFQILDKDAMTGSLKPTSGTAETEYFVAFPLLADLDVADIVLRISAQIKDLALASVGPGIPLSGGNLNLLLEGNKLTVHGDAFLGKALATITYQEDYNATREFDQHYTLSTQSTPQDFPLPEVGEALADYVKGNVKLELDITEAKGGQAITGKVILDEAEVGIPELGWTKAAAIPGVLEFALKGEGKDKPLALEKLELISDKFTLIGQGKINTAGPVVDINLSTIRFGKTDMSVKFMFDAAKKSYTVRIKGQSINAGPFITYMQEREEKAEESDDYASDLSLDVRTLYLANDTRLKGVSGMVHCNKEFCEKAAFNGTYDSGATLNVSYAPRGDANETRQLVLQSGDAGAVFAGFDLLTQVRGGTLDASAISDPKGKGLYEGKLIVKSFKVVKAPLLAKLLTLASFTGIVDVLAGSGISFKKLDGQFAYDDLGQITINGLTAAGSAIGITLDGIINTRSNQLKLDGSVIPAYSINSLLGDIPLIGDTLIGKKGEGIIATRYSVEGEFSDPSVSVNPFSMLTPGFLRKIWGTDAAPQNIAVPVPPVVATPKDKPAKKEKPKGKD